MHATIRTAVPADLPSIVEIYNHAISTSVATFDLEPFSVAARSAWFASFDAARPLLVAERAGSVVGFAYYSDFREKAGYARTKEVTVYVAPSAQGAGVGRKLLDAVIEHARSAGIHVLMAALGGDNPASLALHTRAGFVPAGTWREVGRKFDAWVDVTLLQKIL